MVAREAYEADLKRAASLVEEASRALIVYHDDADGMCAGAIAAKMLQEAGVTYEMVCLEKVHPFMIKSIHGGEYDLYIYADLGSGRADVIESCVEPDAHVVILDHHDPKRVSAPNVLNLNPELYGFSGETEASGSTATYMLAKRVSEAASELAWAAVVGSAEIPGELRGLNREPLEDAIKAGDVEVRRTAKGERYYVKVFGKPWNELSKMLTIMGSVGYYKGGPLKAVEACLFRHIDESYISELEALRKEAFAKLMERIQSEGLMQMENIQWFSTGDIFKGMGTKVVGTFTSMLSYRAPTNPMKYLLGLMPFDTNIPGLPPVPGEWMKVSVRVPRQLVVLVDLGRKPPASVVTEKSAASVGGTGDGHKVAASALVPKERTEEFLVNFDKLAGSSPSAWR